MVKFAVQITRILRDIIQLLPDNIANQIAAGEVIQRPGSAVKELLENAVDAGANDIRLIIQDAGKALIQVIDNGRGMSQTDARMAFERHATSKISQIEDLYSIRTMGFRGEALASIAAVAQVELKTKREEDQAGTFLEIENSRVLRQEPVAWNKGTSFAMKNLFFNVPARRNFLKSNTSELKHIIEEFTRVAMSFPDILFTMQSNGQEVFHLEKGTLKQRIVQLLGNSYNARLVSVHEETDYLNIMGFVGKPDTAKKTRGDQYFFVNNRFIKSPYLHHALMQAFADLIPKDSFPMYALFIDLDPAHLDINVHPTKQEIKFQDDKIVYAFVQSAVKHALAQFSITPTLDFDLDPSIQHLDAVSKPVSHQQKEQTGASSLFRTFTQKNQAHFIERSSDNSRWQDFFDQTKVPSAQDDVESAIQQVIPKEKEEISENLFQLHKTYIVVERMSGMMLIHQRHAHERVLYERFIHAIAGKPIPIQQSLFPVSFELSPSDALMLTELMPDMKELGYQLEPFGQHAFIIQGTPADVPTGGEKSNIEFILEQFKLFSSEVKLSKREKLMRSMAVQQAIRPGTPLSQKEMQQLLHDLFACENPQTTPDGRIVFVRFDHDQLDAMFGV